MLVTKHDDDSLTLELEDERDIAEFAHSEGLFWNDLTFEEGGDGWHYLYDANRDLVYPLDDYGYDYITDLFKDEKVHIEGRKNDDDYADYPWNDDYDA